MCGSTCIPQGQSNHVQTLLAMDLKQSIGQDNFKRRKMTATETPTQVMHAMQKNNQISGMIETCVGNEEVSEELCESLIQGVTDGSSKLSAFSAPRVPALCSLHLRSHPLMTKRS